MIWQSNVYVPLQYSYSACLWASFGVTRIQILFRALDAMGELSAWVVPTVGNSVGGKSLRTLVLQNSLMTNSFDANSSYRIWTFGTTGRMIGYWCWINDIIKCLSQIATAVEKVWTTAVLVYIHICWMIVGSVTLTWIKNIENWHLFSRIFENNFFGYPRLFNF